jgi:proteasome activator subunit 4
MWYGLNSGMWDDQASDLVGQLAITHLDPSKSDPSLIDKIPRGTFNTPEEEAQNVSAALAFRSHVSRLLDISGDIEEDDDGLNYWPNQERLPPFVTRADPDWQGIRKDVGIFTDQEFEFIMSKCLRSLSKSPPLHELTPRRPRWRSSGIFQRNVLDNGRHASQ